MRGRVHRRRARMTASQLDATMSLALVALLPIGVWAFAQRRNRPSPRVGLLGVTAACGGAIGGVAGALSFGGAVLGACLALGPLGWLLAFWAVPAALTAGAAAGGALGAVLAIPALALLGYCIAMQAWHG